MPINLNENEYAKVLADIEMDLESVLKSEREELRKDFPPDEGSEPEPEASPADAESSESAPPEGSESAPPDASGPPDASADPAGAPAGDPGMGGGEDLETKLMNLPEEQLRHLYMAAKQALFARMSQAGAPGAGGPPGAPPPPDASAGGPPGAPPPDASASAGGPPGASPPMPPPAMKSDAGLGLMKPGQKGEMSSNKANGGPGPGAVKLGKNEASMKNEDEKKIADLEQKLELMAKAMSLAFGQPIRKAVVGLSAVQKPGSEADEPKFTPSQVTEKLKNLDQAKLTKHDREAINKYYNKHDLGQIAHLLK